MSQQAASQHAAPADRPLLGVGILGAGPVTQAIHLPALARLQDILEVRHIMDVDAAVASSVAARVGATAGTSMAALLDDPAVDVVAICSPHQFHAFKVLLLLPWVVPIVVSSTAWNWLVATPDSLIPSLFRNLGMGTPLFLADPSLASITVMVFKVWVSFPFMMMMISAALASVDTTVYEAASMDGASRWQQFTQITLPLIARSTYISWILMTIFCVNDFPTIYLLTGGGAVNATTSLVVLAYRTVFQDFATGPGVAIAFLMTMTLVVISVILYRQIRKSSVE